jgi:hypothetical protein
MKVSITGHEKGDLLAFNTCDCHIRPHFHYPSKVNVFEWIDMWTVVSLSMYVCWSRHGIAEILLSWQ